MNHLVNLLQFEITEQDIKIIVEYLAINPELNKELIPKLLKLGTEIKRGNNHV